MFKRLDHLMLGPTPYEEDCAQVGSDDYAKRARLECQKYIHLLRTLHGAEPDGAILRIKSNPHDFGAYYEVAVYFDSDNETAVRYAYHLESHGPATWDDTSVERFSEIKVDAESVSE